MLNSLWRTLDSERGAVSTLAAISLFPVLITAGLLIDSGSAWIARGKMMAAVETAAAVVAMHRPACVAGDDLPASEAEAAFQAASGEQPSQMSVRCTSDGVELIVRIVSPTSLMAIVSRQDLVIGARARSTTATYGGNDAGGWRRS